MIDLTDNRIYSGIHTNIDFHTHRHNHIYSGIHIYMDSHTYRGNHRQLQGHWHLHGRGPAQIGEHYNLHGRGQAVRHKAPFTLTDTRVHRESLQQMAFRISQRKEENDFSRSGDLFFADSGLGLVPPEDWSWRGLAATAISLPLNVCKWSSALLRSLLSCASDTSTPNRDSLCSGKNSRRQKRHANQRYFMRR